MTPCRVNIKEISIWNKVYVTKIQFKNYIDTDFRYINKICILTTYFTIFTSKIYFMQTNKNVVSLKGITSGEKTHTNMVEPNNTFHAIS